MTPGSLRDASRSSRSSDATLSASFGTDEKRMELIILSSLILCSSLKKARPGVPAAMVVAPRDIGSDRLLLQPLHLRRLPNGSRSNGVRYIRRSASGYYLTPYRDCESNQQKRQGDTDISS